MKKLTLALIALIALFGLSYAKKQLPPTVQGVPYQRMTEERSTARRAASDWEWTIPDDMAADGKFTMDMIKNWTGEGSKRAALVIQWNDNDEPAALVFGYRWDGQATGADMLRAVVANNPRLYALIQYTNVSSPTDPLGGYTINGIGWDTDNDGDIALIDTGNGNQVYETENGLFIHPRGYVPGQGGSSDYDYDNWIARDTDDMWGAGWYQSYWSYWVKDNFSSPFSYSNWGASGRVLEDGSWDGWNFALDMVASKWKVFVAAPVSIPAGAKTEFEFSGLYFELKDFASKNVALVASKGQPYSGKINVPSQFVDGEFTYNVTELADSAFANSAITDISLPASVRKIGASAFEGSTLASINVPAADEIKSIGANAFKNCTHFATLLLPAGMKNIPSGLFEGTALTEVSFPATVEGVGKRAFANCAMLASVVIPTSVKSVDEEAFAGSDSVVSVKAMSTYPIAINDNTFSTSAYSNATLYVPSGYSTVYATHDGWRNFQKHNEFLLDIKTGDIFQTGGITYAVTGTGDTNTVKATYCRIEGAPDRNKIAAANKAGYTGELAIPAQITYQGKIFNVTAMNDSTFYGASALNSVKIDAPVESIGNYSFYDCKTLTTVTLPSSLRTLGAWAFAYCEKLDTITLPESLESFGGIRSFAWCYGLKNINIPSKITEIPQYTFYGCAFESIKIPAAVTTLGSNVFQSCTALRNIEIPYGIKTIPSYFLSGCKALESVSIPESVKEIGASAFENCQKLVIKLPANVTKINSNAFKGCLSLIEFTIPDSMTSVPSSLFYGCSNLVTVRMNDDITEIGSNAFRNCTSLENIITADGQTGMNLPAALKTLASYAFSGCKRITEVVLPAKVKSLGANSFSDGGLKTLVLPAGLTSNLTQNNIVQNCKETKIYACMTNPGTVGSFTWRLSGSTSFAEIVVPYGCRETYLAKNYWSKSTITEPALSGVSLAGAKVVRTGNNLVISGSVDGIYNLENMPDAFVRTNNSIVFNGLTVNISYSQAPDSLQNAAPENPAVVSVIVNSDATFSATVPFIEGMQALNLAIDLVKDEKSFASDPVKVDITAPFRFRTKEYDAHFDEKFTPGLVFDTDEYSAKDLYFSSDNTNVAMVNKRTGLINVKRIAGDAVITAYVKDKPEIKTTMTLHSALRNPVTGFILGDGSETIDITYMDILALSPSVQPDNADITTYDISVSDPEVATTYAAKAFNPTRDFWELVTHKPGKVNVTFTAQDGSGVSSTYTVNVLEPDRTPLADNYQDGTFWLNEDWFGHTNGSINYITAEGELKYRVYESQNPYESFGCTSQYGIIHGDRLIVMSKQDNDKGDPRQGGGRVVVADAKTLKKLASFNYIGADTDNDGKGNGDGRACVGAGEDKVYLGTTAGIQVLDTRNLKLGEMVKGIPTGSLYANQLGDMAASGDYAFVIQQEKGVYAISIATDSVVKSYPATGKSAIGYPQGITRTKDGNIWVASTEKPSAGLCKFICINPESLEITDSVKLPAEQRVTCGWGAWRPTNFFGSKNENAIWYGAGVEASIVSGNSGYYKWEVGTDISDIKPVFVFPKKLQGINEKTFQAPYASVRYDDRSDRLLIAATHGASSNYRYNWLHFIDCKTGDIAKTIRMKDYYWFPAIPVFPDKFGPVFSENIPELKTGTEDKPFTINLKEYVTDKDDHDSAIRLSLATDSGSGSPRSQSSNAAEISLEKGILTITPRHEGNGDIAVKAESNGKTSTISLPYTVILGTVGVNDIGHVAPTICIEGRKAVVTGMPGTHFTIFDMSGRAVSAFTTTSDRCTVMLTVPSGVYIMTSADRKHTLKFAIQ